MAEQQMAKHPAAIKNNTKHNKQKNERLKHQCWGTPEDTTASHYFLNKFLTACCTYVGLWFLVS